MLVPDKVPVDFFNHIGLDFALLAIKQTLEARETQPMDVKAQQLASVEQEAILSGLAGATARPGGKFLEVGSWCGHSTVILGKVAQECGGHLFCVDWWKGNVDTELAAIARSEDIFSLFWDRICHAGLEDVVVPLRGRSEIVAQILKPASFRLVFIDGDHRRASTIQDIQDYAPLVDRDGGILCGHDCEGRIADYDLAFLEAGQDVDYHESVHCGVIWAVGTAFADYSINHSIWSVRALGEAADWGPTNLTFPGVPDRRQAVPPPIAATPGHNLLRYGRRVYVVPHTLSTFDVTDEAQRNLPEVRSAATLEEARELVKDDVGPPILVEESYLGFNIVAYAGRFYSVARKLGPVDLTQLTPEQIAEWERRSRLFVDDSHDGARARVACQAKSTRRWYQLSR